MNAAIVMSIFVGLCALVQGGLNKKLSDAWGLHGAVTFNAWVFLVGALIMFYWAKFYPQAAGDFWAPKINFSELKWWFIIPGLCGIGIVMGLPFSISKIGAVKTMIWMIAAQILFSFIWDMLVEGIKMGPEKFAGAVLVIIGVLFISK